MEVINNYFWLCCLHKCKYIYQKKKKKKNKNNSHLLNYNTVEPIFRKWKVKNK